MRCRDLLRRVVIGLLCFGATTGAQADVTLTAKQRVAVMPFSQNPDYERYTRTLQASMEAILADNKIQVLDLEKAEELKNNWDQLEDPSSFISAEDFVERAEKYAVDAIVSLYFNAEVREVSKGYFTATANVSTRVVSDEADARATAGPAMGSLGYAPSDGLTASAALVNALQREVDRVAAALNLEVLAPQKPQFLDMDLVELAAGLPAGSTVIEQPPAPDPALQERALSSGRPKSVGEEITCKATASQASAAAVGLYTRDIDVQRGGGASLGSSMGGSSRDDRPSIGPIGRASYGSSLAVISVQDKRVFKELPFHDMSEGRAREGSVRIHDCLFFNGWRFLIGVSDREIKMYDVEQGRAVAVFPFEKPIKAADLSIYAAGEKRFLAATTNAGARVFELVVAGRGQSR